MHKLSWNLLIGTVIATATLGLSTAPVGAEPGRSQISVSGRVAVICRARLSGSVVPTSDRVALGQLTELCNDSSGYRVIMDYPAALEGARIVVDGAEQTLTGEGQIILVDSPVSAYKVRNLELDLSSLSPEARQSTLNIAFRAVPRRGV
jgi:hypothetical protein